MDRLKERKKTRTGKVCWYCAELRSSHDVNEGVVIGVSIADRYSTGEGNGAVLDTSGSIQ